MKNLYCYLSLLIAGLTSGACTTDNPDNPKQENFPIQVPFTEYSLGETCWWKNCDSTNSVIVINSDEELSSYMGCEKRDSSLIVDFSELSLVLAKGGAISGLRHLDVDFSKEATNAYALNITAHTEKTIVAPPLLAAILVPKIDREAVVTLNVQQSTSSDSLKEEELSPENLRQAWMLIAKKQGDTVEKWQSLCSGDTYPITLVFDSIRCLGICNDVNHYQGSYDVSEDSISFSEMLLGGPYKIPVWYRDYFQDLAFNVHNVSIFSRRQDADNMQLQLTSQELTLYFINEKWFKKIYFEFDELRPYD